MKVLTIKQPWAALIIKGYKKYEFRSWKTNYRGKILIHTGMTIEKNASQMYKNYNLKYCQGMIIGEATLIDCILINADFNQKLNNINPQVYGQNDHTNLYAWQLENIIEYSKPIPCKGKLGLWNFEGDIK